MSSQKGARSKLADVLADIKNSRVEDEYDYNGYDTAPTPAKRRLAVNYVALSGHTPRQSRSNAANSSSSSNSNNQEIKTGPPQNVTPSTQRTRTYVLKLFDRPVDLAKFTEEDRDDTPLYPICRAWVHSLRVGQTSSQNKDSVPTVPAAEKTFESSSTAQQDSTNDATTDVEITSLPPPKSKKEVMKQFKLELENDNVDIRIPQSVREFKRPENVEEMIDKSIYSLEHRECMELNMERWRRVKRDWSEARKLNEARYEESFNILHDMFMSSHRGV